MGKVHAMLDQLLRDRNIKLSRVERLPTANVESVVIFVKEQYDLGLKRMILNSAYSINLWITLLRIVRL